MTVNKFFIIVKRYRVFTKSILFKTIRLEHGYKKTMLNPCESHEQSRTMNENGYI